MLATIPPTFSPLFVLSAFIICVLSSLCVTAYAKAADRDREIDIDLMLEAIRQVENWDGHSRGAAGERGPWQMTRPIWQVLTDKPFDWADSPNLDHQIESHRVAREWVYEIRKLLRNRKLVATPYNVALVWTSGWGVFSFYHPKPVSAAKKDYAQRATNLYLDLLKKQDAETPDRHK